MPFCIPSITSVIITLLTLWFGIYVYFKWAFSYWKKRNVPVFGTPTIPFGTATNPAVRKEHIGSTFKSQYDDMKAKGYTHYGSYFLSRPIYIPIGLDQVKNILTRDFQYFTDRGIYYNEKSDPLSAHLFAIGGNKWRNLRMKLSPTFTSGKMKMMFPTLVECAKILNDAMSKLAKTGKPIDIKDVLGCFTTDIIGSCAFGLNCNSFEDKDSAFRKYGSKLFNQGKIRRLKITFATTFPDLGRLLGVRLNDKDVEDFYSNVVRDAIEYREKNKVTRNDFLQILIDLNKKAIEEGGKHDGNSLTFEEITAQSFVFFIAGFETSSTTMTFALFELANHIDVQEKLREEVNRVLAKHGGEITYDSLAEMKYMDQVIDETLRMYPAVSLLFRKCVKDYKMPDTDVVLEKGTRIFISVTGIHYDEEYYENPKKFDPERFSEGNKAKRNPYAHLPFGEGPRNCVGMRFGLMQSKVGLAILLKNYKFTLNEKTSIPIKFNPAIFIPNVEGGVWVNAEKIAEK